MAVPLISPLMRRLTRIRYRAIAAAFRPYTMVKPSRYVLNLELARRCRDLPGAVVECGTWRGGMIAGLARVLGPERAYHLYDSFEGLPPPGEADGEAAARWSRDKDGAHYYENCTAGEEEARRAMQLSGARNVSLHPGWFSETLAGYPGGPIALLRLDADWYDSTLACLTHLFPKVTPGGLILLDDYLTWEGCARAVHDYLSAEKRPERVREYANAVTYLVKRGDA